MSRRVLLPLFALLFVLAESRTAVSADTPAKKSGEKEESWQAIYIGKARVGFAHVIVQTIERDGIETMALTPAELNKFAQAEIDRWAPLVRRIMAERQK